MVEIIAKSTHNEKRTRDFFKFHLFKASPMRYVYYSIAIIFFVLSVVFYFMKYESSLFFLFLSFMVLIIRIASTNMLINRTVKKVVFPSINYKLTFNNKAVIYSDEFTKSSYDWNDLVVVYEVDDYIFFYIDKNKALILSKFILNVDERIALTELIKNSKVKYKIKKFK